MIGGQAGAEFDQLHRSLETGGAVLGGYLALIPWIYSYAYRITRIGWRALMPWRALGMVLATALLAGGITRLLLNWLAPRWSLLATMCTAFCCFVLCYFLGLIAIRMIGYVLPQQWFNRAPVFHRRRARAG